jgi:hypothetical protein
LASNTDAAGSTTAANNTTPATAGSPVTLIDTAFNIQIGHQQVFTPETRPCLAPSERLVLNLPAAPGSAIFMSGTLYFEEVG